MDAPGNPTQNVAKLLNKNANITHRFAHPSDLINKGFENTPFPFWTVVEAIVLSLKKWAKAVARLGPKFNRD